MWKLAIRSLVRYRALFSLSVVAVMLGVTLLCSTLSAKNLIVSAFSNASTATLNADLYVVGTPVPGSEPTSIGGKKVASLDGRKPVNLELEPILKEVDGVAQVTPRLSTTVVLLGRDKQPVATPGSPTTLVGIFPHPPGPELDDGQLPRGSGEIMLETQTAQRAGLQLGDTATMVLAGRAGKYRVVGIASYGTHTGAATQVFMDGQFLRPVVAKDTTVPFFALTVSGTSDKDVVRERLTQALGPAAQVLTGGQLQQAQSEAVESSFVFVQQVALAFVVLALGLGLFLISNTFRLLTRFQQRDYALLCLLGAERSLVTRIICLQAVLVGVSGGVLGVLLALLLVYGAQLWVVWAGWLPAVASPISFWSICWAFLAGVLVAIAGAWWPARQAGHVSPLEAFSHSEAAAAVSLQSRGWGALILVLAAIVMGGAALFGLGKSWPYLLGLPLDWWLLALATFVLGVGLVLAGPVLLRALAAPLAPLARLSKSVPWLLAVQNLARHPRRSAQGAAALLVGMSVVTGAGVIAHSAATSLQQVLASELQADLVLWAAQPVNDPLPFAQAAGRVTGVDKVFSDLRVGPGAVIDRQGHKQNVSLGSVSANTLTEALDLQVSEGSKDAARQGLAVVSLPLARRDGWSVGDSITIVGPLGIYTTRVGAVAQTQLVDAQVLVSDQVMKQTTGGIGAAVSVLPVKLKPGTDHQVGHIKDDLLRAAAPFQVFQVFTKSQFESHSAAQVRQNLLAIYGLLALSLLIAFLSITNTLALSLLTRREELRLLHRVGMSVGALRRSLTFECLLLGVFSCLGGVLSGLAWAAAWAWLLKGQGLSDFSIPWAWLGLACVVACLGAVLAGAMPAGRGARLAQHPGKRRKP